MKSFDLDKFEITGKKKFNLEEHKTKIRDFYDSKEEYEQLLAAMQDEMDALQNMMYAHNRYGVLVIFQAMDAAGKDGTMKAVFRNVNPQGLRFHSFKRPSETELNHDYLWRCLKELPERGMIQVFNRSYYEEVLVVKVHPEILKNSQKLPVELTEDMGDVWEKRYQDISSFEKYLTNNGIRIIKFFLNVSKEEQALRLIERIEDPSKNWKFEEGDVKERALWKEYQGAYQEMIRKTSDKGSPWYVVPADDKKNMRLIVAKIILENLKSLKMNYPESDEARKAGLKDLIEIIRTQNLS